jgi:septal ring factor EnvC (AmiA/AmiB activator)
MVNRCSSSRRTSDRWNRLVPAAAGALLVSAFLSAQAPPQPAQPTDRARAEAAAQRVADRLKALQREAESLATQERSLLGDLRKLEIDRQMKTAELEETQAALEETQRDLTATVEREGLLKKTADTERPDVESRLVRLYKMGHAGYWRLLLDVDDLRSIGRAYRTAAAMTRIDGDRLRQHRLTLDQLQKERKTLEARTKEMGTLRDRAARAQREVERAVVARTALVESIDRQRDLNAQLTGELEAAQLRLQGALGQLASGRPATVSVPLRPFKGALTWPAQGIVTGPFGRPRANAPGVARTGIEISMAEGLPVRAVHEGTVAFADPFTGYGNLVILDHGDGAFSLYGHLASIDTSKGARVGAQERVGRSGRNPSGNPSLYFELRIDGKPVDPLQWLKK